MIELKFIGRGSAFTKDEVNNSAYFIKNNTMVLFDCGADVFKQIINHKLLNQPNINKLLIIITHTHDDHIGSLMSLLEYCRYSNRAANIEEVQLFETIESLVGVVPASPYQTRLNTFANIFGMSIEWLKKVVVVSKSQVEDELNISIESIPVSHSSDLISYGYYITDLDSNQSIYYSGDCNSHDPALDKLFTTWNRHIDFYLEVSSSANAYPHSSCHFAEIKLPSLINSISSICKDHHNTYTINLMHIDPFDSYKDLTKKLIVNTIDYIK